MITECLDKEKTRKLYEEAFDDPKEFVDYYYSEKCRDNKIIVSIKEGEVLSMLHLNPYYMNLWGTVIKTYYIVAVATREDKRHQGYMSEVFKKTFEILKNEHIPFVFLLPVDEKIYSWMGFEKICDFALDKIKDYEVIKKNYDVYCIWDEIYIKRMAMEDKLREADSGEVLPDSPVIMAKITDLSAFNKAAGCSFISDKEALEFLKTKRIYICEEV